MKGCKLVIEDEVNIKLEGLDIDVRRKIANVLKYEVPYAQYMPQYKLGRWDGKVAFFGIGGTGYVNHLDRIIEVLDKNAVSITEIEDRREKVKIEFEPIDEHFWATQGVKWPVGHAAAGQLIMLRDYQVAAINNFLKNPQSLQEIATGSGKCLSYSTELAIELPGSDSIVNTQIGKLAEHAAQLLQTDLVHNQEIDIRSLGAKILTPTGIVVINHIIKKENLNGIKITLVNESEVQCAAHHILQTNGINVYASSLTIGDTVDTITGSVEIVAIEPIDDTVFYDIGIDAPHLYYDASGVLHHNTITTATLSRIVEKYGRSLTIVPNKSLVVQTEEDYRNCGLDVGVYFGDRKELGCTHTICTWQSLNILDKRHKNGVAVLSLAEMLDGVNAVIVDECFHGDTLITTPTGKVPIKELKSGDRIVNFCEATCQYQQDTVVKVHENLAKSSHEKMLELEFDTGSIIQVTANHLFLTTHGWVRADQLSEDTEVIDSNTHSQTEGHIT